MKLKNTSIERVLTLLNACIERKEYFSQFGKAWKKAYENANKDDLIWLQNKIGPFDSWPSFKAAMEKELSTRKDGVKVWSSGTRYHYLNGRLHRDDGPAVEWSNGRKEYYLNGVRHRANGPAVERADGHKEYYLNGRLHRIDGPAVEYSDGRKGYWENGVRVG